MLARDDEERHRYLKAWLVQASEGDRKQIRNLIVEHGLATSNEDPLLTFADSDVQEPIPLKPLKEPGSDVPEQWQSHKEVSQLEEAFRGWMEQAPQEARDWTVSQEDPALLDLWRLCQVELLTQAPGGTPRSAYELSLEIADAPQQKRAVQSALHHWLKVDPQRALGIIAEAPLEEAVREQLTQWAMSKVALLGTISKAATNAAAPGA